MLPFYLLQRSTAIAAPSVQNRSRFWLSLGGRHFESYSEDPVLSGNIAAAYINGLQSQGIGATIKHFVANETEWKRRTIDVRVSEKALCEIYYMPFQIVMRHAMPWCIMTSYV
jgi:beta-glucosidase